MKCQGLFSGKNKKKTKETTYMKCQSCFLKNEKKKKKNPKSLLLKVLPSILNVKENEVGSHVPIPVDCTKLLGEFFSGRAIYIILTFSSLIKVLLNLRMVNVLKFHTPKFLIKWRMQTV